ncbi:hypothetical protein F4777DRAFT_599626 [Nemania sp. FL0916]|nr:hypothetical protein F4777DRAFT_599626 [Nemania sp. FL0916]
MLASVTRAVTTVSKQDWILDKLGFEEMSDREYAIDDAHKSTFRWLLEDSSDRPRYRSPAIRQSSISTTQEANLAFQDWLSSDNGIFFISGKAGSGKSTLMKFLADHAITKQCLESWAASTSLVFGRFFFWNAGTEMQRSIEGLYRSMLSELLRQCPAMMEVVFPQYWSEMFNPGDNKPREGPLRLAELESAFRHLISNGDIFQQYSVCLFIDGLYEYEGDHWKLAKLLKDWAKSQSIKICVSSRPHNEFIQNFDDPRRHLKLHELTRKDIWNLVESELGNDERFTRMVTRDSKYSSLISSVAERADGVFLWVRLVIRQLLSGLGSSYSIKQLEEELVGLPQDLKALYHKMFACIKGSDAKRAAQTFLLLTWKPHWNYGQRDILVHSVIDEALDDTFDFKRLCLGEFGTFLNSEDITERIRVTIDRLNSRCKGLVQIHMGGPVGKQYMPMRFIHRTVHEFFSEDAMQEELLLTAKPFKQMDFCIVALLRLMGFDFSSQVSESGDKPEGWGYGIGLDGRLWMPRQMVLRIINLISDSGDPCTYKKELAAAHLIMMKLVPGLNDDFRERSMNFLAGCKEVSDFRPVISGRMFETFDEMWLVLCSGWGLQDPIISRLPTHPDMVASEVGAQILLHASVNAMGPLARPHHPKNDLLSALLEKGFLPNARLPSQFRLLNVGPVAGGSDLECPLWRLPHTRWTVWTLLLHALTAVMHCGEPLLCLPGFFETFLSYGADPSVLFVGYRIVPKDHQTLSKTGWVDLDGIYYFDLRKLIESSYQPTKSDILYELDRKQRNSPWNALYDTLAALWSQSSISNIRYIEMHVLRSSGFVTVAIINKADLRDIETSGFKRWAEDPLTRFSIANMIREVSLYRERSGLISTTTEFYWNCS